MEELRQFEYSQRLRDRLRVVLAQPGQSAGRRLYDKALAGGARALGRASGAIEAGKWADLVALDLSHDGFAALSGDAALDAWIFSAGNAAVSDLWSAGRRSVRAGRHVGFTLGELLPEATKYDYSVDGITETSGEIVIDETSDPPFDPAQTYYLVIGHKNCPSSSVTVESEDLGVEPPVDPTEPVEPEPAGSTGGATPDPTDPVEDPEPETVVGCACRAGDCHGAEGRCRAQEGAARECINSILFRHNPTIPMRRHAPYALTRTLPEP